MVGAGSVAVEGRKRVERAAAHLMRAVERRAILFLVVEVDSSASVEEAQVAVVERVGGELVDDEDCDGTRHAVLRTCGLTMRCSGA